MSWSQTVFDECVIDTFKDMIKKIEKYELNILDEKIEMIKEEMKKINEELYNTVDELPTDYKYYMRLFINKIFTFICYTL